MTLLWRTVIALCAVAMIIIGGVILFVILSDYGIFGIVFAVLLVAVIGVTYWHLRQTALKSTQNNISDEDARASSRNLKSTGLSIAFCGLVGAVLGATFAEGAVAIVFVSVAFVLMIAGLALRVWGQFRAASHRAVRLLRERDTDQGPTANP